MKTLENLVILAVVTAFCAALPYAGRAQCVITTPSSVTSCSGNITFTATSRSSTVNHHIWYDAGFTGLAPTEEFAIDLGSGQVAWTSTLTVPLTRNSTFYVAPACNTDDKRAVTFTSTSGGTISITMDPGSNPGDFCIGQAIVLTATNGTNFTWTHNDNFIGWGASQTATESGVYLVAGNNSCNEPVASSITLKFNPTISNLSVGGATMLCQGTASTQYTAAGSNFMGTTWSIGDSDPSADAAISSDGLVTWNGVTGAATVTLRAYGCNGSSSVATKNVSITASPSQAQCSISNATNMMGCAGLRTLSAMSLSTSVTQHKWYTTQTAGDLVAITRQYRQDGVWISELDGNFLKSVTYWAEPGCDCGTIGSRVPVVFRLDSGSDIGLSMNPATDPADLCENEEIILTGTGSPSNLYQWRVNDPNKPEPDFSSASIRPTLSATYYLKGANRCGEWRSTDPITLTFNPPISNLVLATDQENFCVGAQAVTRFNASSLNAGTYQWDVSAPGKSPLEVATLRNPMANIVDVTWNATFAGTATIQVTADGCHDTRQIRTLPLTVHSLPNATISPNGTVDVPFGTNYTTLSVPQVAGNSYQWYVDERAIVSEVNHNFDTRYAGLQKVKVTSPFGCSSFSDGVLVRFENSHNVIIDRTLLTDRREDGSAITEGDLGALSVDQQITFNQYFDGLGRPMQTVDKGGSPLKRDVVTPFAYDPFGREVRKYLPFVSGDGNGWYKASSLGRSGYGGSLHQLFYSNGEEDLVKDDSSPYAESVFQPSPLNRIVKQGAPGAAWQPDATPSFASADHTIKFAYESNLSREVLLWTISYPASYPLGLVNAGTVSAPHYYAASELEKKKTKDEAGHVELEYKDKQGRVVLKRVQAYATEAVVNDQLYASTYYVYDALGNLACVIPPEATRLITQTAPASEYFGKSDQSKDEFLGRWAFRYVYDNRKRMAQRQVPGAQPIYMVYDQRDRLVMTQDGNQRITSPQYWTFTKYDELNRPILNGIKDTSTTPALTQAQMQTVINTHYTKSRALWGEAYVGRAAGNIHGYSNKSYPIFTSGSTTSANHYLTVTYYDTYAFKVILPGPSMYNYDKDHLEGQEEVHLSLVNGQVTGARVKVLDGGARGGNTWLTSVSYYDERYRLIQAVSDNYKAGIDTTTNIYDFSGKLLATKTSHTEKDLNWISPVSITVTGATVTKDQGPNGFNSAGAISSQQLGAGADGWFEFEYFPQGVFAYLVGVADTNPDEGFSSIDYAFYVNGQNLSVYENGLQKITLGALSPGDILRIERTGTRVRYKRNGTTVYTSATSSGTSLFVDLSFYHTGATIHNLRSSFSGSSQSTTRTFGYDHAGRRVNTWHQVGDVDPILLIKCEYNELGQLVDKKLHSSAADGRDARQSLDYRYTIRGWLATINDAMLTSDGGEVRDYFGMEFAYNEPLGTGNIGAFNGDVSGTKWSSNLGLADRKALAYNYTYDPQNRLTDAALKVYEGATWVAGNGAFNEGNLEYDLNGNMKRLVRNKEGGTTIDDLVYIYNAKGSTATSNRLMRVTDSADDTLGFREPNHSDDDYKYDANGNMVWDRNKGGEEVAVNGSFDNGSSGWTTPTGGERITFANGKAEILIGTAVATLQQAGVKSFSPYLITIDMVQTSATGGIDIWLGNSVLASVAGTGLFAVSMISGNGNVYQFRASANFAGSVNSISIKAFATTSYNFLNLPEVVARGKSSVRFVYSATGQKLCQVVLLEDGSLRKTDYAGEYFYENDTLKFINNEEGRVIMTGVVSEYQYYLRDHLGNVRTTFTTKDEADIFTATLEEESADLERNAFSPSYHNATIVNATVHNHTRAGSRSQRLSAANENEVIGLTKGVRTMAGDTIRAEVWAKFMTPTNDDVEVTSLILGAMAMAFGVGPESIGEAGHLYRAVSSMNSLGLLINAGDAVDKDVPKAYLNYILFDENFAPYDFGFQQVSRSALHAYEKLQLTALPSQSGYAFVYLSNENDKVVEVYFDDFKVVHEKSPVVQSADYYPFGLTFNLTQRGNSVHQNFLFNGKERIKDLSVNIDDFGARMYDPALGRWRSADPRADGYHAYSPFNFAINSPLNVIDPDGRDIYILTWFSEEDETGHVGIAIDNYKTQIKKDGKGNDIVDANGNPVTEQVKDGTYTYFDLWPHSPVGGTELQDDVPADYSRGKLISSLSELTGTDVTTGRSGHVSPEGRAADGVLKITASFAQDESARRQALSDIAASREYNATSNNCSTFAERVLNAALTNDRVDASQDVRPPGVLRLMYNDARVVAPNNLYNSAMGISGAVRIKGPAFVVAKPYLEYFGKQNRP